MESFEIILNRDFRKAEIKVLADLVCPTMDELINRGTHILAEGVQRIDKKAHRQALPNLCHAQLDMLDACSVMFRNSVLLPTYNQVRVIMEAGTYSRFICMEKENFEKRALCYVYETERQLIRIGKAMGKMDNEDVAWAKKEEDRLREHPIFGKISKEHSRIAKERHGANWYSLFGGPRNYSELLEIVFKSNADKKTAELNRLMHIWISQTPHANDMFRRMVPSKTKRNIAGLVPLRSCESMSELLNMYGIACSTVVVSLCGLMKMHEFGRYQARSKELIEAINPMVKKFLKVDITVKE